jgi:hypothetical protein
MRIILFRGRPGTGKTTLSTAFGYRENLPVLRKDDFYDAVSEFIAEHDARNRMSYRALYNVLASNSKTDSTFILDYPFQHAGDLGIVRKWSAEHGVMLKSILVTCSDEKLWARRLEARAKNPTPNQIITDFHSLRKLYGAMQITPEEDELSVDTVESIENILPKVVRFVSEWERVGATPIASSSEPPSRTGPGRVRGV